jgi:hypothetical protein
MSEKLWLLPQFLSSWKTRITVFNYHNLLVLNPFLLTEGVEGPLMIIIGRIIIAFLSYIFIGVRFVLRLILYPFL